MLYKLLCASGPKQALWPRLVRGSSFSVPCALYGSKGAHAASKYVRWPPTRVGGKRNSSKRCKTQAEARDRCTQFGQVRQRCAPHNLVCLHVFILINYVMEVPLTSSWEEDGRTIRLRHAPSCAPDMVSSW